ncbi:RHS repeat-associated core domain-containing protein [Orbus sturtevantii]|uniref:RHS repeat-associated core domain-containing protein n=1 Tax=Orbus sturtevantii TaxID=3074109 RepID=UPI00370DA4B5
MITKNKKRHKVKLHSKQNLTNKLLAIFIMLIMVIVSLPKMAYAQLFNDGDEQISGVSSASVKLPNTEYTESTIDLRVKVLGGEVKLNRTWNNGRWYINPAWENLRFVLDPLDSSIKAIDRAGTQYQRTGDKNLYTYEQVFIKKTDTGWHWFDQQGDWIDFDAKGRVLEYGNANNVKVSFLLDNEGRRIAITDHFDEQVYRFSYDNQEHLTKVTDREGRTVSYQWSGDKLIKVIDVMGNPWLYGYDKNGQLNQKTEPDGGVIKIDYTLSTPAPKTAMTSGKDGGVVSQNAVVTTGSANRDTKLAQVGKITDKTGAVTIYNSQYGRVNKQYTITINDPLGKKTVTQFDAKGRVLSKTVNDSFTERYQRDEANHLVNYTNPRGLTTTTQYNQANYPIKVTYPNGATELYEYNKANKPVKLTNAKGDIITFEYDASNNPIKVIYAADKPEQRIVSLSYDNYGQQIAAVTGEGDQAINLQRTFDRYGNIATYTDGKGYQYQYSYNIQGQLNTVKNPLQQIWQSNYNLAGYLLESIDPLNHRTYFTNDAMGRVINVVDAMGNQTQYSYAFNKEGRDVKTTNALNQVTTYQYDTLNRLVKTVSPTRLEAKQVYNTEGKLIQEVDIAGNVLTYEYGAKESTLAGLLTKALYPTFSETYNYNALGKTTEVNQLVDNNTTLTNRIVYDQLGLMISTIDAANRVTQTDYNGLGQAVKSTDALGGKTRYNRDLLGNITQVTDANGNQYRFEYDKNSNLIKETKALGNDVEYRYNEANQLIEQTEGNGNRILYQYDAAGNNIKQSYFERGQLTPEQVVTYSYNEVNQLVDVLQIGDIDTHFVYQRDALGKVTQETITYGSGTGSITKTLKYAYDQEANLASITYPDNTTISYTYDKNRLKQTTLANGEVISWDDYQWYMPAKVTYPNAIQTNRYDPLMRFSQIGLISGDKTLFERQYSYDKVGNIIRAQTEHGENSYQYDLLDRLTLAKPSAELQHLGIVVESYHYDAIGNRIGSANQPGDWTYNHFNQLTKWGENINQTNLTYTANSQLATEVSAGKHLSYHYNAANRLVSVKNENTELARYQYDPFGRRISKTTNGEITYFIYTDEGLIAELDSNGKINVAYGWQPDSDWGTSPLWQASLVTNQTLQTAAYNFLIADQLGTPQLAINNQGQQTWKIYSDVFGNTALDLNNQISLNLRFPGQYYDQETGLSYNYFRDYNPKTGRYIQSDPIGLNGGINTFSYVGGNPLLYRDPSGLSYWDCVIDHAAIVGVGGAGIGYGIGSVLGTGAGAVGGGALCGSVTGGLAAVPCGTAGAAVGNAAGGSTGAAIGGGAGGVVGGIWGMLSCSNDDNQDQNNACEASTSTSSVGGTGSPNDNDPNDDDPNDSKKQNIKMADDRFLKKKGFDAHEIKKDFFGKGSNSKYDIYIDKNNGELILFRKGGLGDGIRTGQFIK